MRTLAVLAALLIAGLGLARLTGPSPAPPPPTTTAAVENATPGIRTATYELLLSGNARRVKLDAGGSPVEVSDTAGPLSGRLEIGGDAIFLEVEWADGIAPGHRFARLRLEEPGRATREHVFSAAGNIDDLWEP